MKRFAIRTLAAACLAAAVGPACATATSSVVFGNLVITLTDLNPTDSISPWLSFTPNGLSSIRTQSTSWGDVLEERTLDDYAPGPNQDFLLSRQLVTEWSSSSASVNAAANAAGFTAMSAQGTASSGLDAYGKYFTGAKNADGASAFQVSAMTAVTFSVLADVKTQTSMGYNLEADMDEYAHAFFRFNLAGTVNGISQYDDESLDLESRYYVNDDNTVSGLSNNWSGQLSVSFFNYGAVTTDGFLQAVMITDGYSAAWDGITPVPEPATYAMMLGGLGLIGVARRRSKKAA